MVALAALHLSMQPPSVSHPYGYGHYESLGTLAVSSLLLVAGLSTAHHSLLLFVEQNIADHTSVIQYPLLALGVVGVSVASKEFLYRVTEKKGRYGSHLMSCVFRDRISSCIHVLSVDVVVFGGLNSFHMQGDGQRFVSSKRLASSK